MTKVDIWNKSLAMLPHDRRVTAEDDGSTEALRCADAWDDARKAVIGAANWGFLTRATPVCKGSCAVGQPYKYFYPRPREAVRVIGMYDKHGRRVQANAFNGGFLSNCVVGSVRFIKDSDDYDDWPVHFTQAVVAELASRIAGTITGSVQLAQVLESKAVVALSNAKQIDASEVRHDGADPEWIAKSRNSGGFTRSTRHDIDEDVYWT